MLTDDLLPRMRTGRALSAVAFAHVRRPGAPNPVATRVPGGWRLDGVLDWVTSWDIADVVMVMAQGSGADADRLVCCYLPAGASPDRTPGVTPGRGARAAWRCPGRTPAPCGSRVSMSRTSAWARCWTARRGWQRMACARRMPARPPSAWLAVRSPSCICSPRVATTTPCAVSSRPSSHECRAVRAAAYAAADAGSRAQRIGSACARPRSTWPPGPRRRGRRPVGCGDAAGVLGRATAARVDVPAGAGPDGGHPAGLAVPHAHARAGGTRRTVTHGPLACVDLSPSRHRPRCLPCAARDGAARPRAGRGVPAGPHDRAARRP